MRRLAWALIPLAGGCFWAETLRPLAPASSDWYEVGPVRKPVDEVMKAAHFYLVRSGYVIPAYNPADLWFETSWDTHMSSHWREGFRTKVEVEFEEQANGSTLARIRSYREYNEESKQPMIEEKAKWIGASVEEKQVPLIPEPAIKLQQQLKMKFIGLGNE